MGQLREVESKLTELGYQIVVISPDRPEKIREFDAKGNYDYTLLSDSDLVAASALGVTSIALGTLPAIAAAAKIQMDQRSLVALSERQATTLPAMAERILPTTETPGAREAGAVWLVDEAPTHGPDDSGLADITRADDGVDAGL